MGFVVCRTRKMSCIEHPDLAKFAIIRPDLVAIAGDGCAGLLLSVLEGWTNWLKQNGKSLWVDLSGNELSCAVAELFNRKRFMKAGKLLEDLGLVVRKQKNSCDRTYQYLLQLGTLQQRLNLLVFWNTAATYIQAIASSATSSWMMLGSEWLKSLLRTNVPEKTLEELIPTTSKVTEEPRSIDKEKNLSKPLCKPNLETIPEDQRENFLEFGRKQAAALPEPPVLPDKWIEKNKGELYRQFKQSARAQPLAASEKDWRNELCFEEWIHQAFHRGYEWVNEDTATRQERSDFYRWASKVNAFLGVCYEST